MSFLTVDNISKQFSGLTAVADLSFEVEKGEIVGLIGPNGAGKTTVFNMLSGFLSPTKGEIFYKKKRITGLKPHQICENGITRTFQIVQPFPELSVVENTMIGAFAHNHKTEDAREKAMATLKRVQLEKKANKPAKELTLLELKRLEIGKALATEPELLLLDEVAAGLKDTEIEQILNLVRQLNQDGMTLLIVEHLMKVIMNLSRRIIVIDFGKKIAEGTPVEIANDPAVLDAYLGKEN